MKVSIKTSRPITREAISSGNKKFTRTATIHTYETGGRVVKIAKQNVTSIRIAGSTKTGRWNNRNVRFVNGLENQWVEAWS